MNVLDLGCGSGRDVYALAQLVGPDGYVVGLDMTDEQLQVAEAHKEEWASSLGLEQPNMRFVKGEMEDLAAAGIESNAFDLVVSNCVINLSPDKQAVLDGANRVLKVGGELHFSDVYSSRRVPQKLRAHPTLHGECLAGALYCADFKNMAYDAGFHKPRALEGNVIDIEDKELSSLLGPNITFYSITFRLFKLPGFLEPTSEDYGHTAVYKGTLPGSENKHRFRLDESTVFEANRPTRVDGNTAAIVSKSWLAQHFDMPTGDFNTHYGPFGACDSVPDVAKRRSGAGGDASKKQSSGASCCS